MSRIVCLKSNSVSGSGSAIVWSILENYSPALDIVALNTLRDDGILVIINRFASWCETLNTFDRGFLKGSWISRVRPPVALNIALRTATIGRVATLFASVISVAWMVWEWARVLPRVWFKGSPTGASVRSLRWSDIILVGSNASIIVSRIF